MSWPWGDDNAVIDAHARTTRTDRIALNRAGYWKRVAESFWHRVGVYFGFVEEPPDAKRDVELAARSARDIITLQAAVGETVRNEP